MQVCKLISGFAGLVLCSTVYAQSISNPEMPAMPAMPGMPSLETPFYTPSFPSNSVVPKKKSNKNETTETEKQSVITNNDNTGSFLRTKADSWGNTGSNGGTVTLNIVDLYPDIAMTPSNDPVLFVNNSSLVEYLATNCGLNLLESQFTTKVNLLLNNLKTYPGDSIDNAISSIGEKVDDILYEWSGL